MPSRLSMLFALCSPLLLTAPARADQSAARAGYSLELLDSEGRTLPTFAEAGNTYVLGALGTRYSLRLRNRTGARVEFVAAVDGRDVLDGQPSAYAKRGYIVDPYGDVTIDGFRLNADAVAAFRFSRVSRSYAGQMGDARDVGVIGVAVFGEQPSVARRAEAGGARFEEPLADSSVPHAPASRSKAGAEDGVATGAVCSLAAPASPAPAAAKARNRAESRPGLGTEFGEARQSHANSVAFARESELPATVLSLRYDDCAGLARQGVNVSRSCAPSDTHLRESAQPFRRDPGYATPPPGWNASSRG